MATCYCSSRATLEAHFARILQRPPMHFSFGQDFAQQRRSVPDSLSALKALIEKPFSFALSFGSAAAAPAPSVGAAACVTRAAAAVVLPAASVGRAACADAFVADDVRSPVLSASWLSVNSSKASQAFTSFVAGAGSAKPSKLACANRFSVLSDDDEAANDGDAVEVHVEQLPRPMRNRSLAGTKPRSSRAAAPACIGAQKRRAAAAAAVEHAVSMAHASASFPAVVNESLDSGKVQGATEGRDPHVHSDVAAESHDSVDCGSLESEADGDVSSCCGAKVHCHASSLSVGTDAEEKSIVNEAFVSGMVLGATEGRDPQSAAEAAQPRSAVVSVPLLSSGLRPSVAPNTLP